MCPVEDFKKMKAQKQINKLVKKYNSKKVVIYGAGKYSKAFFENYDLSGLNIVGVADRAFEEKLPTDFFGLKCIKPSDLANIECDVILLCVKEQLKIFCFLRNDLLVNSKNFLIDIKPLIEQNVGILEKIKLFFKFQNCFRVVKTDFIKSFYFFNIPVVKKELKQKNPYKISGINNHIYLIENGIEYELPDYATIPELNISIIGNDNIIRIEKPISFLNSSIFISYSYGAEIFIGKKLKDYDYLRNLNINILNGVEQRLKIGEGVSCHGVQIESSDAKSIIEIGKECLLAGNVVIRGDDGHAIIDKNDNIVNYSDNPLIIGKHCWIGEGVKITKNAQIPNDTIIGIGSIVTKKFTEEGTVLAGIPAKIIRREIRWERDNIYKIIKRS